MSSKTCNTVERPSHKAADPMWAVTFHHQQTPNPNHVCLFTAPLCTLAHEPQPDIAARCFARISFTRSIGCLNRPSPHRRQRRRLPALMHYLRDVLCRRAT